jgi:hypothetical protein
MSASWYDTSFRKLFFDFHSPGQTSGLAAAFDAEAWADRLQAAGVQAVSVFTKCGYGYSFYQKGSIRYQHPHLPPGLDMVQTQIDALHRRGIRAIGYYHTFNSEPVARDHPDWIERDADGAPRGTSICLLSPLAEEWMLPHIEEIVTLYDVDSMFFDGTYAHSLCYCDACRRRFAEATGGLEVPRDETDPAAAHYVVWKLQALRGLRQAICDTIHRRRPEVVVSVNWAYTPRAPEAPPKGIGALVADIFPDDQVFNGSFLSSYWSALGKPFDVMNSAFLQWWGDWGCKPAVAMQQEVATTIAHGGLTWIGYQMTHEFDVAPAVMVELGKTLAFVREREPLLVGAEIIPDVAVLHTTAQNLTAARPHFFVDELAARGAHRLLTESMIPHHMMHEATLLARLGELSVVIVPDQRYLSPQLTSALKGWVENGGALIATALTGTLDADYVDTGRFALEDLLGVKLEGVYDQTHAYVEVTDRRLSGGALEMPLLAEATFALAQPVAPDVQMLAKLRNIYLRDDGKFLLRWSPPGEDSGYPAITLRRVGKGCAAYLAGELFRAYQVKNQWSLRPVIANLLRIMRTDPAVTVEAPAWVEVTVMKQAAEHAPGGRERLLIHLVNLHGDRPTDNNNRCSETIPPVRDVQARVRLPQRPHRVTLEPDGAIPKWHYADGELYVFAPEVVIHRAIAVELEG